MSKTRNKRNDIVNSIDNKPEQNNINSFSDNEKKEKISFKEKVNKHHDSGYQKSYLLCKLEKFNFRY